MPEYIDPITGQRKGRTELVDIVPTRVSLVSRPANRRKFLLLKHEEESPSQMVASIVKGAADLEKSMADLEVRIAKMEGTNMDSDMARIMKASGLEPDPYDGTPANPRDLLSAWVIKQEELRKSKGTYGYTPHEGYNVTYEAYRRLVAYGEDGARFNGLLSKSADVPALAARILEAW